MADWCSLPGSAVVLIGRRIQLIEDFIAFRSICSPWRQSTTLMDFCTSSPFPPKLPLLMCDKVEMLVVHDEDTFEDYCEGESLQFMDPEEKHKCLSQFISDADRLYEDYGGEEIDEREFMILSKGNIKRTFLFPQVFGMTRIGSKGGWIIMAERMKTPGNMCLFHLLTRARIPLPVAPPKSNIKVLIKPMDLQCAALSSIPFQCESSSSTHYVVMASFVEPEEYLSYSGGHGFLGYWKPGNQSWTRIEIPSCVFDLNYFDGKFYALTVDAQVWMCDVLGPNPNNKATKIVELPWGLSRPQAKLVECGGRLLIVAPLFDKLDGTYLVHDLEMVEIDVVKGSYTSVMSLGSSAVFLGSNQVFSIDANKFPGILMPNSIYFPDGSYKIAAPGPSDDYVTCLHDFAVWINF